MRHAAEAAAAAGINVIDEAITTVEFGVGWLMVGVNPSFPYDLRERFCFLYLLLAYIPRNAK